MTVQKLVFAATAAALTLCATTALTASAQAPRKLIPVEQFTLANGMKVIFHVDRSDRRCRAKCVWRFDGLVITL